MSNPWTSPPLTVDGIVGPKTTKALQWVVGVAQDGSYGPVTASAHERWLALDSADADLRPWCSGFDAKAVQNHLWALNIFVAKTGVWDTNTTKGIQIALNNGTY